MKEGRQTVFFTLPNPFGHNPDEEEPSNVLLRTRKSALSQQLEASSRRRLLDQLGEGTRKGTAVWQSRSYAIIVDDSLPADGIENVAFRETTFYESFSHRVQLQEQFSKMLGN